MWYSCVLIAGLRELCYPCPLGKVTEGEATYGNESVVCIDQGKFWTFTTVKIHKNISISVMFNNLIKILWRYHTGK